MTILTAIGLMAPPSLDGIDAALITTDGENHVVLGEALHQPYNRDMKIWIRRAIKAAQEGRDGAADIGKAAGEITLAHTEIVEELLERANLKRANVDVIGFHGQTLLHRPATSRDEFGRTWQIGDAPTIAEDTRIDVVSDFRSTDIQEGGRGGPIIPTYLQALTKVADPGGPVGVINLDEVATLTYLPLDGHPIDIMSFDCGPSLGLLDQWMEVKTGQSLDQGGEGVRDGRVHTDILRMLMLNPFLRRKPPKYSEGFEFKLDAIQDLSTADGAATLTAFTAACVRAAEKWFPEKPIGYVVTGVGRSNKTLMEALEKALEVPVESAEGVGWRGDFIAAEMCGYLAVRSLRKLPLTYPAITRVPRPLLGGIHSKAPQ